MIAASRAVLLGARGTVHPGLLALADLPRRSDRLRLERFGAPEPLSARGGGVARLLTLQHGDFVATYADPARGGTFDAVVTSFFLDACDDVLACVATIAGALRPGGLWFFVGPLHWHKAAREAPRGPFARGSTPLEETTALAVPALDELLEVAAALGFERTTLGGGAPSIDGDATFRECAYGLDGASLAPVRYRAASFVLRKGRATEPAARSDL
jgi:SAM-dependent methyltransferase